MKIKSKNKKTIVISITDQDRYIVVINYIDRPMKKNIFSGLNELMEGIKGVYLQYNNNIEGFDDQFIDDQSIRLKLDEKIIGVIKITPSDYLDISAIFVGALILEAIGNNNNSFVAILTDTNQLQNSINSLLGFILDKLK